MLIRVYYFGNDSILNFQHYSAQPLLSTRLIIHSNNKVLSWRLRPNLNTYFKGFPFITNSQGFRDKEFSEKKISGITRIAVLGKSIAMGEGVLYENAWPQVLQNKLNIKKQQFEVYNFSVSGHETTQLIENYKIFVKKHKPDFIIIPIYLEEWDLPINLIPQHEFKSFLKRFTITSTYLGPSFLIPNIKMVLNEFGNKYLSTDWRALASNNKKISGHIKTTTLAKIFGKMINMILADNTRVIVFPYKKGSTTKYLSNYSEKIRKIIKTWIKTKKSVHLINLDKNIKRESVRTNRIFYGDRHPNKIIHEKIATLLYEELHNKIILNLDLP